MVDSEKAIMDDGGAGQTDGEAEAAAAAVPGTAPVPPIHYGDLVTFKSKGEHGDRGLVLDMGATPEDKVAV